MIFNSIYLIDIGLFKFCISFGNLSLSENLHISSKLSKNWHKVIHNIPCNTFNFSKIYSDVPSSIPDTGNLYLFLLAYKGFTDIVNLLKNDLLVSLISFIL